VSLAVSIDGVRHRFQLRVAALQHLKVRPELRGQLSGVGLPVRFNLLFLIEQPTASVFELRLQKLVRIVGEHFAVAQVLFDEQRGEPLRDPHHHPRVVADEADAERIAAEDLDADVAAHLLDDVLHDSGLALLGVQIEVPDDTLETRAAQNLLDQGLEAIFDSRRDRRTDVALRNALRYDENHRLGAILVGQVVHPHRGCRRNDRKRQQQHPDSRPENLQHVFRFVDLTG
jgi:hypothetical protein